MVGLVGRSWQPMAPKPRLRPGEISDATIVMHPRVFSYQLSTLSSQQPDDTEHLAERDWQIPITLAEPIRREATLLTLYISTDRGTTWKKEATAKPTDEFFKYVAPGDGNYWFSVSFVNRSGQTIPAKE